MKNLPALISDCNYANFNEIALKIFHFQAENCIVLKNYLHLIGKSGKDIHDFKDLVYLPIRFFKTANVTAINKPIELTFKSSGTQGNRSSHHIYDTALYENSFIHCFEYRFGNVEDYCHLALLPNYQEQGNSSLVYMVNHFVNKTTKHGSAFFLTQFEALKKVLLLRMKQGKKTILWGVTFALLDFIETFEPQDFKHLIVIETGGMKGRREELTRSNLHEQLSSTFINAHISSEYGMTELLSQAYWDNKLQVFKCPKSLKVSIREVNDPFSMLPKNRHGAINIIDLNNWQTCSFIETEDLGILKEHGFEVLGRLDNAESRGCSLMYV